jgi:CubicO group peptidase (beta-lactamase class C family)
MPLTPEVQKALVTKYSDNETGRVEYSQVGDAHAKVEAKGVADFRTGKEMTPKTISGIGSITKQFTAATLIKLWDDELTERKKDATIPAKFPDGIDTKLSDFMKGLKEKFPQCEELFTKIEGDESYKEITLRDLLNHTHGLGGRDGGKAMALVRASDKPIELADIANTTSKTIYEGLVVEQHGVHDYSNFGFDLAAMIVESVTGRNFDEVVRKKVLAPNGLTSTHPQSDHLDLYRDSAADISRGYIVDSEKYGNKAEPKDFGELKFNVKSNTRAAGGFKSSVADLARFARLYMGAEMFESEEVKDAVVAYGRGAPMAISRNEKDGTRTFGEKKYHLAMEVAADGAVGHSGADCDFYSDLRFTPKTSTSPSKVETWLSVVEDLTSHVCDRIFAKTNPEDSEVLQKFLYGKGSLLESVINAGRPAAGSELFNKLAEEALSHNKEAAAAISRYAELQQEILKIPASTLAEKREEIIEENIAARANPSTSPSPVGHEHVVSAARGGAGVVV